MSWIQKLVETYDNCQSYIGSETSDNEVPLLPICHTTQMAQIQIALDEDGNFLRARVVPKSDARTIIPCTESSSGRTSGLVAHPLCDKLQYIAKDYQEFGGSKKTGYDLYEVLLGNWCSSEFSHPKTNSIYHYIKKGEVIRDLVNYKVLFTDENGKLLQKWDDKQGEAPEIFKVSNSNPEDAFVRWEVELPVDPEPKVWKDQSLWDKWIKYYSTTKDERTLCYISGIQEFKADQHPAKIRNDGDKAKLISANDLSGFTFLGRFTSADQAAGASFIASQKAHYALRWLISRQGFRQGDLAIVAWATTGVSIPNPTDDPLSILGVDILPLETARAVNTAQAVAYQLKKKIAGYQIKLGDTTSIVVMALDSATTGRMAITYYRVLSGSDFLGRLDQWHSTCAWLHRYILMDRIDPTSGKTKKVSYPFIGAPSPKDIAEAAYGRRIDDKLKKSTISRILPCIIDGLSIPRDLVESTIRRASNRVGMRDPKDRTEYEWNKTLSIACALYRKYKSKEVYDMALDPNRNTRDYLYGRLLALADSLEEWALNQAKEKRDTNAARLMQRFAERPYTTWRTIELALTPYKVRLGGKSKRRQRMIDEVIAMFAPEDFINDKRLSGEFLLGYHCQKEFLRAASGEILEPDEELQS